MDDFPENPELAYKRFFPSEATSARLVFEDSWPKRGDYDFNDLVLDYSACEYLNPDKKIKTLNVTIRILAAGSADSGNADKLCRCPGQKYRGRRMG